MDVEFTWNKFWRTLGITVAVFVMSAGWLKLEDNQRTTNATADTAAVTAAKLRVVVDQLRQEAHDSCTGFNDEVSSQRSTLEYLKSRQETIQAELTPAQIEFFSHALSLIPANKTCPPAPRK